MAFAHRLAQFNVNDPSVRWGLIAMGAALLLYVLVLRPMGRKKDPLSRKSSPSSLSQQRAVERDMTQLLVELSEMARKMTAQIDTRSTKLELLIKEADEKIAALKAAGHTGSAVVVAPQMTPPQNFSDSPPDADPPAQDSRHFNVYALADEGRDARAIARELQRPTGEIELILALRGKS